jgi:hypothetical protein
MLYIPIVEFNKETLQPHLNQLEEKLYEMTNKVNEEADYIQRAYI